MQRLGKSQIPLAFEAPGTCEQDGQAAHEEVRPVCPPGARFDIARGTEIEQIILVIAIEFLRQVPAVRHARRHGDQCIARSSCQRSQCLQITGRIAFQPG